MNVCVCVCVCMCLYIYIYKMTSSDTKIYLSIKKIIIIIRAKRRVYCRRILTEFNIFPPVAKYFSHCYNFLYINWKHIEPNVNLNIHQTEVCYPGIKVVSNLQPTIKNLNDVTVLKPALKKYSVISLFLLCVRVSVISLLLLCVRVSVISLLLLCVRVSVISLLLLCVRVSVISLLLLCVRVSVISLLLCKSICYLTPSALCKSILLSHSFCSV